MEGSTSKEEEEEEEEKEELRKRGGGAEKRNNQCRFMIGICNLCMFRYLGLFIGYILFHSKETRLFSSFFPFLRCHLSHLGGENRPRTEVDVTKLN